jgi:hypothetical protein
MPNCTSAKNGLQTIQFTTKGSKAYYGKGKTGQKIAKKQDLRVGMKNEEFGQAIC